MVISISTARGGGANRELRTKLNNELVNVQLHKKKREEMAFLRSKVKFRPLVRVLEEIHSRRNGAMNER